VAGPRPDRRPTARADAVFGHDLDHARVGALGPRYDVFPVVDEGLVVLQLRDKVERLEGSGVLDRP